MNFTVLAGLIALPHQLPQGVGPEAERGALVFGVIRVLALSSMMQSQIGDC